MIALYVLAVVVAVLYVRREWKTRLLPLWPRRIPKGENQ